MTGDGKRNEWSTGSGRATTERPGPEGRRSPPDERKAGRSRAAPWHGAGRTRPRPSTPERRGRPPCCGCRRSGRCPCRCGPRCSTRFGRIETEGAEGFPVVEEPVNHGRHRHTEGGGPVIGLPGRLRGAREMGHSRQSVETVEVSGLVERQGGIERAAGDQVSGLARRKPGAHGRIVVRRFGRPEPHTDARMGGLESRQDPFPPDGPVVIPPAFEDQYRLAKGAAGDDGGLAAEPRVRKVSRGWTLPSECSATGIGPPVTISVHEPRTIAATRRQGHESVRHAFFSAAKARMWALWLGTTLKHAPSGGHNGW